MSRLLQKNFILPGIVGLVLGSLYFFTSHDKDITSISEEKISRNSRRATTRQMISLDLEAQQETLDAKIQRAVDLVDNGETEDAHELFEKIIIEDPNNIRTLLELSLIELLDQGRPDKALPYLIRALKVEPENDLLLGEVADIYVETGNYQDGVDFFKKMLVKLPKVASVQLRIGQLYYYKGDYPEAIKYLEPISKTFSHGGQAKSLMARIFLNQNKLEEAISLYSEAEHQLESGVTTSIVSGEPGDGYIKWLENLQIEMAEGLISKESFQYAEDILYKLSARIPSDPEVIKLMDLAKIGKRSNAG